MHYYLIPRPLKIPLPLSSSGPTLSRQWFIVHDHWQWFIVHDHWQWFIMRDHWQWPGSSCMITGIGSSCMITGSGSSCMITGNGSSCMITGNGSSCMITGSGSSCMPTGSGSSCMVGVHRWGRGGGRVPTLFLQTTSLCRLRRLTNECRLEDKNTCDFSLFKQNSGGGGAFPMWSPPS